MSLRAAVLSLGFVCIVCCSIYIYAWQNVTVNTNTPVHVSALMYTQVIQNKNLFPAPQIHQEKMKKKKKKHRKSGGSDSEGDEKKKQEKLKKV